MLQQMTSFPVITLTSAVFFFNVPSNHDSVAVSKRVRCQEPETKAIINNIHSVVFFSLRRKEIMTLPENWRMTGGLIFKSKSFTGNNKYTFFTIKTYRSPLSNNKKFFHRNMWHKLNIQTQTFTPLICEEMSETQDSISKLCVNALAPSVILRDIIELHCHTFANVDKSLWGK